MYLVSSALTKEVLGKKAHLVWITIVRDKTYVIALLSSCNHFKPDIVYCNLMQPFDICAESKNPVDSCDLQSK